MKYKLKIPEMIPKRYAFMVEELDRENIEITRARKVDIGLVRIWIKDSNMAWEIPPDWIVEEKESAFQKWYQAQPMDNSTWDSKEECKQSWNAAIDAVVNYWWKDQPLNTKLNNFIAQDILQFKETQKKERKYEPINFNQTMR